MRSKAHKTLCQNFIKSYILDASVIQQSQLTQLNHHTHQVQNKSSSDQMQHNQQMHESDSIDLDAVEMPEESLYFDTFVRMCLIENQPECSKSQLSVADQDFIYFEKLSMVFDLITFLQKDHIILFHRLLATPHLS